MANKSTDIDDDIRPPGKGYGVYGLGFLVVLLIVGIVPKVLGLDWFAMRLIASKNISVYVLNTSGQDLEVSLSHGDTTVVVAGTMEPMQSLSGDITITTSTVGGEVLEELEYDASGNLFYNALGSQCLAVLDVSSFYGNEDAAYTVVERITRDDRIYPIVAGTVMLPRFTPPDTAVHPVHWIETFGCDLLDPDEEGYLLTQANVRLSARWEELEEARRAYRGE